MRICEQSKCTGKTIKSGIYTRNSGIYHFCTLLYYSWYPLYKLESPDSDAAPSAPSVASRGRAAHARWPTSVLAVGRDPLGALMAPEMAVVAAAAATSTASFAVSCGGE